MRALSEHGQCSHILRGRGGGEGGRVSESEWD